MRTILKLTTSVIAAAIGALVIFCTGAHAAAEPSADLVLGQINLTDNTVNFGGFEALNNPQSSAVDGDGHLYVADGGNNRVLGWRNADALEDGDPADIVIGQPDAFSTSCRISRTGLCGPLGVALDSHGNLFVTDGQNNRVLAYAAPFGSGIVAGQPAAKVFGQGGRFTRCSCSNGYRGGGRCGVGGSSAISAPANAPRNPAPSASGMCLPNGIAFDGEDNLYVSDGGNNRILIFLTPGRKTAAKGSGDTAADATIGQTDFRHNYCNNRHASRTASATSLCEPTGVAVDHTGNLYVADSSNSRVLEYDTPRKWNTKANIRADRVFGQGGDFRTTTCADGVQKDPSPGPDTLCGPIGVATDPSGNLFVAQSVFSNILEYNTPLVKTAQPGSGDETADLFIGRNGSPTVMLACNDPFMIPPTSASCLAIAVGVSTDKAARLYVADSENNRVLRFDTPLVSGPDGPLANFELGQPDLMHDTVNRGGLAALNSPTASVIDSSGHLYAIDSSNNRILGWSNVATLTNGTGADLVIGQPDAFYSNCTKDPNVFCEPNAVAVDPSGNLYVADFYGVRKYDAPFSSGLTAGQLPSLIFGQSGCGYSRNSIGPDSICGAGGIAFDVLGNLYIADTGNNRVLEYNTPLQKTAVAGSGDITADHVLGQSSFAGYLCGDGRDGNPSPNASSLCGPTGIVVDASGNVFVADSGDNRVLEYGNPFGAGSGAGAPNATLVFGQNDFAHLKCMGGFGKTTSARGLCNPTAVALDKNGNLYISDTSNNRVLEYYTPLTATSINGSGDAIADLVFGQSSFAAHVCEGGQRNTTGPNDHGLCNPVGLSLDSGNHLFVSDTDNHRVLRFAP